MDTDAAVHPLARSPEGISSLNAWFKALFDSNSEGIEDNILRWVHHCIT
jgi:mediator of RNA polymerase II transcription subunit 5